MTDISEGLLIAGTGIITVFGSLAVLCATTLLAMFTHQRWFTPRELGDLPANPSELQTVSPLDSDMEAVVKQAVRTTMKMDLEEPERNDLSKAVATLPSEFRESAWILTGRSRQFGSRLNSWKNKPSSP